MTHGPQRVLKSDRMAGPKADLCSVFGYPPHKRNNK